MPRIGNIKWGHNHRADDYGGAVGKQAKGGDRAGTKS
jgi:hypothetical protein